MDFATADLSTPVGNVPEVLTVSQANLSGSSSARSLGYPGDPYGDSWMLKESTGSIVPATEDTSKYNSLNFYESDSIRAHHGMSGGPLLNAENHVIGINSYEWHDKTTLVECRWGFRRITSNVYTFLFSI
ncbi:S1 family peptidase [Lacticaseibacillus parakribbianus]|uniref:S1 family peptidase n=1 Tax=Lacticaseibacillus parakribbianus TaxID=2970927 RepID=UPI003B8484B3